MTTSSKAPKAPAGRSHYYAAYARAHGKPPEDMLAADRAQYPGGSMCGFIIWVSQQKQAFWSTFPEFFLDHFTIGDTKAWAEFLEAQADKGVVTDDHRSSH